MTKVKCTKCGSDEVYIKRDQEEAPEEQTMDEMIEQRKKPVNLVYKPITWACKECGYSITE